MPVGNVQGLNSEQLLQAIQDLVANSSKSNIINQQSRSSYNSKSGVKELLSRDLIDLLDTADKVGNNIQQAVSLASKQVSQLRKDLATIDSVPASEKKEWEWYRKEIEKDLRNHEKYQEQLENRLLEYKLNLWRNASIQQKANTIQQKQEEFAAALEVYERKKTLLEDLSDEEKDQYRQLTEEKAKYDKQYFEIQKSLAREGSRQTRYSNYKREVDRIKEEQRAQEALNREENKYNPEKQRQRTAEINLNARNAIRQAGELYGVTRGQDTTARVSSVVENVAGVVSGGPSSIVSTIEGMLGKASPVVSAIMAVLKVVGSINKLVGEGIQKAVTAQTQYMGSINARMQRTSDDDTNYYNEMLKWTADASSEFGLAIGEWNSFVNKTTYIEKLNELVSSGIAYNAEERALLATLSDRMVTTFDALDASLTRLIRIQQRDMTYAAMGSEALITEFLNAQFRDTSYLNNMYDQVSGILLDATAKMSADQSAAFSYEVQKWLGSLYSVGLSESGVQQLAQGLTYLATGDVSQLTNNQSLQYIYAAAAERGGMSLADILVSGLDIDTTNNLLKNVVSLLSDVYSTSSTNPVQSAWASITGMSIADLRSVQNLNEYMSNISSSHASWVDQVQETQNQLNLIYSTSRTGTADKLENLMNNLLFSIGENLLEGTLNWDLGLGLSGESLYLPYALGQQLGGLAGSIISGASLIGPIRDAIRSGVSTFRTNESTNLFQRTGSLTSILSNVEKDLTIDQTGASLDAQSWMNDLLNYEYLIASVQSGNIAPDMLDSYLAAIESSNAGVTSSRASLPNLVSNAETAAAVASAVVNESSEDRALLSEAVDVQDYLFENEQTIRVTLALVEDRAATKLAETLNIATDSENLEAIKNTVQSKVNVDLVDNDVNSLLNNIYTTKWSM